MNEIILKKRKLALKVAWVGLVVILLIICVMIYALYIANGMLALAMIVALGVVSVLFWIGIGFYKRMITKEEQIQNIKDKQTINDLARMNTKNL